MAGSFLRFRHLPTVHVCASLDSVVVTEMVRNLQRGPALYWQFMRLPEKNILERILGQWERCETEVGETTCVELMRLKCEMSIIWDHFQYLINLKYRVQLNTSLDSLQSKLMSVTMKVHTNELLFLITNMECLLSMIFSVQFMVATVLRTSVAVAKDIQYKQLAKLLFG